MVGLVSPPISQPGQTGRKCVTLAGGDPSCWGGGGGEGETGPGGSHLPSGSKVKAKYSRPERSCRSARLAPSCPGFKEAASGPPCLQARPAQVSLAEGGRLASPLLSPCSHRLWGAGSRRPNGLKTPQEVTPDSCSRLDLDWEGGAGPGFPPPLDARRE